MDVFPVSLYQGLNWAKSAESRTRHLSWKQPSSHYCTFIPQ